MCNFIDIGGHVFMGMRELFTTQRILYERWGAGVETQKNVRGEIGGWGRVPFNEPYGGHVFMAMRVA